MLSAPGLPIIMLVYNWARPSNNTPWVLGQGLATTLLGFSNRLLGVSGNFLKVYGRPLFMNCLGAPLGLEDRKSTKHYMCPLLLRGLLLHTLTLVCLIMRMIKE